MIALSWCRVGRFVCVNFLYLGLVFGNFEIVERVGCHEQL